MRRLTVVGVVAIWLAIGWSTSVATPLPAAAAGTGVAAPEEHRAAVVVDTGTQVKSVCVRFKEESISGIDALALAQVDPVLQGFSGKGAAVCALCGVGCPAGNSCLTCNPEGKFWSYSRAPAGNGAFRTSGVGASSTTVHDGDVEGWKWALGGSPPFLTVEQVCGEPPAATTTSTAVTSVAGAQSTTTSLGTSRGPASSAPTPMPGSTTTRASTPLATSPGLTITSLAPVLTTPNDTPPPNPSATDTSSPSTTPGGSGLLGTRTLADREGGHSDAGWPGFVGLAALLLGLAAWTMKVRRSRRARPQDR